MSQPRRGGTADTWKASWRRPAGPEAFGAAVQAMLDQARNWPPA